ncbi:kinesin [Angomonas deanei]|nr:kinesin [Angomonas deanei]|eukprot:EPY20052.1 kinesin [Angomonas deanei]
MICAISPMEEHRSQTMQTLAYASKARRVVNRPVVEEDPSAVELRRANEELINLRKELNEAKRTGQQYGSIEEQLKEAYEKIKRDQLEMREKKQTMEKREADLANRLREVELKKQEYEAQMASLENEVELARSQQQKREEELRKAYAHADEVAKVRLQQLQEQRDASEQALRAKEEELLSQQHVVEERLADLETTSRARVEELLRRQRDLEEELRMKEKMAVKREQDLRKKTELAEEQARHLSRHTHLVEEEWNAKVQEIERRSKERESEISKRAETAQARLQALEDEARRKDEEMRRKRLDAEAQARTLEAEMETKQAELDRRILELRRQADARENELNEKLHKAEFELRKKERESLESKEALDALKETAARESELSRSRELDLSAQHAKMAETVVSREAALKKREADLNKQFEELLQTKKEWEREYRQKEEELRVGQEESLAILRGRGTYLKQKESELRQIEEDIESKTRILEMETQRKELEFESRRNDLEAQLQRENYANLRAKEELQFQLDRQQTDMRLQQEKLQRWEEDLLKRRTETEKAFQHRETTLRQRESAAANAEDRANAKESQAEKLVKRLEHERRELFDRSINEAESNRKEYNSMLIRLKRQQREIDALHRAASEEQQSTSSRSVSIKGDEIDQIMTAQKALFRRELYSMMAFESLYRGSIIVEEDTEYRTLMKEKQMEMRDIKRVMEIRNQMGELSILRGETDRANDEHSKAQDRLREYQCENENLKEEISRCMNESAQLRLQLSMTTSIARDAEDSLQRVNRDLDVSRVQVESVERELRVSLSEAHATCAEEMRRANRLARGLNNMIFEEEERERAQLELQFSRDVTWMKNLALAERKNVERLEAIGKWESLYEERSAIGLGGDARAVDLNASDLHDQIAKNHALNACQEGLNADLAQLQKRIDEFDAYQRAQLRILGDHENSIQQYLLELEEMDKARMKQYREREQELLKIATQLKDKENMTGDQLQGVCKALFAMANEPCTGGVPRHIIEEDGRRRMERMEKDRELLCKALEGDTAALEELKRRQDEHLQVEECILLRRMDLADEEELKRRKRLQEQEEQILQYLLLLEQEDIRRGRTSKDGDQLFRDAEARLQKAKTKENNLRDLARRLQLEALELEEQSRLMESNLQIRERDLELLRERKETIEGRRAEANSRVDDTERTLLDLETDLRALLNKNKDTKRIMKAREAEIKRQRLFYKDLSKMLEERDRMLLEEHNHRMDGKKSANWLARDLLDYNDKLKKYVKTTRQRWLTLLNEDLLECDLCNWKNGKLMKFCKCCGHDLLLGDPELLDSKL